MPLRPWTRDREGVLPSKLDDWVADADDHGQLRPRPGGARARVAATTGHRIETVLSDGGGPRRADPDRGRLVAGGAARRQRVVRPEAQQQALADPFHQEHVPDDAPTDPDTGPAGRPLDFRGTKTRTDRPVIRVDRGEGAGCRVCPHFGSCTTDSRQGRALEVGPHAAARRAHRMWMASEEARTLSRQRKEVIEPVCGVVKEELGGRRPDPAGAPTGRAGRPPAPAAPLQPARPRHRRSATRPPSLERTTRRAAANVVTFAHELRVEMKPSS